jgi:hypothetical protein
MKMKERIKGYTECIQQAQHRGEVSPRDEIIVHALRMSVSLT